MFHRSASVLQQLFIELFDGILAAVCLFVGFAELQDFIKSREIGA